MSETQSKVVEILDKRLETWAETFAAIYDEEGEEDAIIFIDSHVPEKYHELLAPYVKRELEALGYIFEE